MRHTMTASQHNYTMPKEDSPSHVRIHPQCGACGFAFTPGDRIVARERSPFLVTHFQ